MVYCKNLPCNNLELFIIQYLSLFFKFAYALCCMLVNSATLHYSTLIVDRRYLLSRNYCHKILIHSVLNTFLYDPLVEWKKEKRKQSSETGETTNEKVCCSLR